MKITAITVGQFAAEVLGAKEPVLVVFQATWCPVCARLAPELEQFADDFAPGLKVVAVDIDAQGRLADRYDVAAVPTLVLYVRGRPVRRFNGAPPAQALRAAVEEWADPAPEFRRRCQGW